jgi:hypothetical protein
MISAERRRLTADRLAIATATRVCMKKKTCLVLLEGQADVVVDTEGVCVLVSAAAAQRGCCRTFSGWIGY